MLPVAVSVPVTFAPVVVAVTTFVPFGAKLTLPLAADIIDIGPTVSTILPPVKILPPDTLPVATTCPAVVKLPPATLAVTVNELNVPTDVMLGCAAVVTVPAVVAAPVNAPTNVVDVTLLKPATVVTVDPNVSAVLPKVTEALARRACANVTLEIFVALIDVTLAPDPFNIPTKLPDVVLPVTAKLPKVPRLVIFV
jgi:hypothetical protein